MTQAKVLWGLKVHTFPKHKRWAVDQDYVQKLNDEEKEFLSKFNDEFYRNKVTKGSKTGLHSSDRLRKDCYARENAANRDLYAIKQTGNAIISCSKVDEDGNLVSVLDTVPCPRSFDPSRFDSAFSGLFKKTKGDTK